MIEDSKDCLLHRQSLTTHSLVVYRLGKIVRVLRHTQLVKMIMKMHFVRGMETNIFASVVAWIRSVNTKKFIPCVKPTL